MILTEIILMTRLNVLPIISIIFRLTSGKTFQQFNTFTLDFEFEIMNPFYEIVDFFFVPFFALCGLRFHVVLFVLHVKHTNLDTAHYHAYRMYSG